jgi:hypothetical protein
MLADDQVHSDSCEVFVSRRTFMRLCVACAAQRRRQLHRLCFLPDVREAWQRQYDACFRRYQADLVATLEPFGSLLVTSRRCLSWAEAVVINGLTTEQES